MKIRSGKIVNFTWNVLFNGEVKDLTDVDLEIVINCPDKENIVVVHTLTAPNIVKFTFRPKLNGLYRFSCFVMDENEHIVGVADRINFEAVPLSTKEELLDTPDLVAQFAYITGDMFVGSLDPAILTYYTTKQEINDMAYVTYTYLDERIEDLHIGDYVTQAYMSSQSYVTDARLVDCGYATTDYVDEKIETLDLTAYVKQSYMSSQSYVQKDVLDETLDSYATKEWVCDQTYVTEAYLDALDLADKTYVREYVSENADKKELWVYASKKFTSDKGVVKTETEFYNYLNSMEISDLYKIVIKGTKSLLMEFTNKVVTTTFVFQGLFAALNSKPTNYMEWAGIWVGPSSVTEQFQELHTEFKQLVNYTYLESKNYVGKQWVVDQSYVTSTALEDKNYATKEYVRDQSYVTSTALEDKNYATKEYVRDQSYVTSTALEDKNYADKQYIVDQSYVTSSYLEGKNYADKEYIVDQSYVTSDYVSDNYTTYSYLEDRISRIPGKEIWVKNGSDYTRGSETKSSAEFYNYLSSKEFDSIDSIGIRIGGLNLRFTQKTQVDNYVFEGINKPADTNTYRQWVATVKPTTTEVVSFPYGGGGGATSYVTYDYLASQSYVKSSALDDYAKKTWVEDYVDDQEFATESYVADYVAAHPGGVDLSAYVKHDYLSAQSYVTSTALEGMGYVTADYANQNYTSYAYVRDYVAEHGGGGVSYNLEQWDTSGTDSFVRGTTSYTQVQMWNYLNSKGLERLNDVCILNTTYNVMCRFQKVIAASTNTFVFAGAGIVANTGNIWDNGVFLTHKVTPLDTTHNIQVDVVSDKFALYTKKSEYDVEEFKFQKEDTSYITKKIAVFN